MFAVLIRLNVRRCVTAVRLTGLFDSCLNCVMLSFLVSCTVTSRHLAVRLLTGTVMCGSLFVLAALITESYLFGVCGVLTVYCCFRDASCLRVFGLIEV